jgi:hypothetical protein
MDGMAPQAVHPTAIGFESLQQDGLEEGLQVMVKLDEIEMNLDEPSFPGSDWHIEGLHSEHVVANSVYVFEEDNTSEPRQSSQWMNC